MLFLIAVITGMGQPCMYSINARLKRVIGSPYRTTLISYTVSLLFLTAFMSLTGKFNGPMFGALLHEPFWVWINGVIGIIGLTLNILIVGRLGGVMAVILPLVTQILGGLLIDAFGFFRSEAIPLSIPRAAGAVLVLVGVGYTSLKKQELASVKNPGDSTIKMLLWYFIALISGVISASMSGIYRYMGSVLGSSFRATFVTTVVGCVAVGIISLIPAANKPFMMQRETGTHPRWIYFGGVIATTVVTINVWLTQRLGVGMTLVFVLLGNTIGGILVDHFGLFGVPQKRFTTRKLIGIVIMLIGATLYRLT